MPSSAISVPLSFTSKYATLDKEQAVFFMFLEKHFSPTLVWALCMSHAAAQIQHQAQQSHTATGNSMPLELATNRKGHQAIIFDGHWYNFHKKLANGRERWTCFKRGGVTHCLGAIKTDKNEVIISKEKPQHTCATSPQDIAIKLCQDELRKDALENPATIPSNIINKVHNKLSNIEIRKKLMRKRNASTKIIQYARRKYFKFFIKEPKNLKDLKIKGQ